VNQNPAVNRDAIEAKGWHATANQNILPPGYTHFVGGDWTTPERFDRIEQLLAARPQHSRESLQAIQNDVMSLGAKALLPVVLTAKPEHPLGEQALKILSTFDCQMRTDSAAALVFNVWADELTRGLLVPHLGGNAFSGAVWQTPFPCSGGRYLETLGRFLVWRCRLPGASVCCLRPRIDPHFRTTWRRSACLALGCLAPGHQQP
jgi:hypothetical protein